MNTLTKAVIALALSGSMAHAGNISVYSTVQSLSDLNLNAGQEITAFAVANYFKLSTNASLQTIEFYIAPLGTNDLSNWVPQTINYYFFPQTGAGTTANPFRPASTPVNAPGSFGTVTSPDFTLEDTGVVWASAFGNTGTIWKVDFNLPTLFSAVANTNYWLALNLTGNYGVQNEIYWVNSTLNPIEGTTCSDGPSNPTGYPCTSFYSTGPVLDGPPPVFSWPAGNGNPPPATTTVAFQIFRVPEPDSIALFALGLGALLQSKGKRKSTV